MSNNLRKLFVIGPKNSGKDIWLEYFNFHKFKPVPPKTIERKRFYTEKRNYMDSYHFYYWSYEGTIENYRLYLKGEFSKVFPHDDLLLFFSVPDFLNDKKYRGEVIELLSGIRKYYIPKSDDKSHSIVMTHIDEVNDAVKSVQEIKKMLIEFQSFKVFTANMTNEEDVKKLYKEWIAYTRYIFI